MAETHNNDQPKPCPHCGSDDLMIASGGTFGVICLTCGAATARHKARTDALAAWNRRALPWVAVAERLPEPEQVCLWWKAKYPKVYPKIWKCDSAFRVGLINYTHWLPLSDDFFPAVDKLAQRTNTESSS